MGKSAVILGATGLTGSILLRKLIEDDRYDSILVFGRKPCGIKHVKLKETITDLLNLENESERLVGDTVFCCIGTTKAKTKDKAKYRQIDRGIPISAARISRDNNINKFIVVSALGANPNSRIFYNRVKGEMEEELLEIDIPETYILQPSLIKGQRQEDRLGEEIGAFFMKLLKPLMIGDLRKYKPIPAEDIADCMIWLDQNQYGSQRITSDEIMAISNNI